MPGLNLARSVLNDFNGHFRMLTSFIAQVLERTTAINHPFSSSSAAPRRTLINYQAQAPWSRSMLI
jgi:hypothetical protein